MQLSPPIHINQFAKQALDNATATTMNVSAKPTCGGGGLHPDFQFNIGLHVIALFVILTTSTLGNVGNA